MKFYKLQTNRANIKKLISAFKKLLCNSEKVVSPRPLAGKSSSIYVLYISFEINSIAHKYATDKKLKLVDLTQEEYSLEISKFKYFWE